MHHSVELELMKRDVVFLHGWGLNSGVWRSYITLLREEFPEMNVHLIDLPGYGTQAYHDCSGGLHDMAESCLARAPDGAVWVGWSLGGMVAMQAALLDSSRKIEALQLICTSPRFVNGDGWEAGVDVGVFQRFSDELAGDYQHALSLFLLLQSGASFGARSVANQAHAAICEYDSPSPKTLQAGIDCLARSDLRGSLSDLAVPAQVVVGERDRVANPVGGEALARLLNAELVSLNTGHSPFLTRPLLVIEALAGLFARLDRDD